MRCIASILVTLSPQSERVRAWIVRKLGLVGSCQGMVVVTAEVDWIECWLCERHCAQVGAKEQRR